MCRRVEEKLPVAQCSIMEALRGTRESLEFPENSVLTIITYTL